MIVNSAKVIKIPHAEEKQNDILGDSRSISAVALCRTVASAAQT